LLVIGVTGTDGKSSTAQILLDLLRAAGLRAGMLSTIKAVIGDAEEPLPLHVTTPEAPLIQRYLRRMVDAGLTHVVLETTSHALAQGRVTAVAYDVAAVTNITHEHLDYHGTLQAYFAAKQRLFEITGSRSWRAATENEYKRAVTRTAVLNRDDSSFSRLGQVSLPRQISYGLAETADVTASGMGYEAGGVTFTLSLPQAEPLPVSTSLVGEFNVYNMLAAAAVATALDLAPEAIRRGLESAAAISGRMEAIDRGQPFRVIVDFAHSPISLEKAIALGRSMLGEEGRVITVFGSAGERDVAKRSLMAAVSARDADLTVLTAEDPRRESLSDILSVMAQACREEGGVEGETFWRIPDRGRAIYHALTQAEPPDLVLICGKGHEQSICFGETEYPWDDREATRAALDAFLAGRPMVDLGLPTFAGREA
jgi:UDP-N-acetylmuramoyl-L-alanyl-D-glutamate--2,6-diaminopimelate ligase